jgi:hypothetical protein
MTEHDEEEARRRATTLWGGIAALVVVVLGWLVIHAIQTNLAKERCVEEGHRYCDGTPVEIPRQ